MSALSGVIHFDGSPVEETTMDRMLDRMAHRAPDGRSVHTDGPVGFGFGKLHTLTEDAFDAQPLLSPSGVLLAADIRLDNREDLYQRIGDRFLDDLEATPDSRIVLAAYERWGEAFLDEILGDFALALWDPDRQRLLLARDHMGVKQLYVTVQPGRFVAFASEIKALLTLPDVSDAADGLQVASFFELELMSSRRTIYREVDRVEAGTLLFVTRDGTEARRYWSPVPQSAPVPSTDAACAERFAEIFSEAVRCRTRTDQPIGSELSGGLDSSYVTCVAREFTGDPLPTVSLIYDMFPGCDERPYIEAVTEQGGLTSHYASAESESLLPLLAEIYGVLDDGRASGNHHLNWLTLREASKQGLRVMLTGQDGDSTVYHGWEHFRTLVEEGRWDDFEHLATRMIERIRPEQSGYNTQESFRSSRDVVNAYVSAPLKRWAVNGNYVRFLKTLLALRRRFGISPIDVTSRLWRDLLLPRPIARRRRDRVREAMRRRPPSPMLSADLLRENKVRERLREARIKEEAMEEVYDVRAIQQDGLASPFIEFSLEKIATYAGAFGIEPRHPFMDKRLIEYCLALPPEQSFSDGWSRVVMRRAMKGVVPEPVRTRVGKASLAAPYRHLLLERTPERLAAVVEGADIAEGVLDVKRVRDAYQRRDTLQQSELAEFARALSLILWMQTRASERA